ncbi:MAG: hypothetical protein E7593_03875 [Ruminococcaceae bacterium]|nr:hypothetical protein [Oscillospiraceae bacterium]
MKRLIYLALVITLLLCVLSGCKKTDVWDGSVAESFQSGKGTESKPYTISKASQLAYLAKEVNSGNDFSGKYIALTRDIDLNNIEWTPIGNGKHSFNGIFNGNNHTINHLSISNTTLHNYERPGYLSPAGFSGLFGFCKDSEICNLSLSNSSIHVSNVSEFDTLRVGTLVAQIDSTLNVKIDNIKINSSSITIDNSKTIDSRTSMSAMAIGGLIGNLEIDKSGNSCINRVQCNKISITYGENYLYDNFIGGIIGNIINLGNFECCDFSSYLSTQASPRHTANFYFGAFGYTYKADGYINLSNGFSKLSIAKSDQGKYGEQYKCLTNAIIGSRIGSNEDNEFNFKNLFGYIETTENNVTEKSYSLYIVSEKSGKINEKNCVGCESLPKNHGLDPKIWDLSDLANPKLK